MSTIKVFTRALPRPSTYTFLPRQSCRHESTTRRHKKLNTLPPAPSYTSSTPSATLIFNPPSSAPNIYHTPPKFLPKTDRRRQLYSAAETSFTSTTPATRNPSIAQAGTSVSASTFFPPSLSHIVSPKRSSAFPSAVRPPYEKKYHLSESDISEIRRLRLEDPDQWSRQRLADKFGCSQFFVQLVCKVPEKAERVEKVHEVARKRWGGRRRLAREDRVRRRDSWGRDA